MKESKFTLLIRKSLEGTGKIYAKKIVAAMGMSMAGIPDIIGCYNGMFFGIECKCVSLPKRNESIVFQDIFSENQIINLDAIEQAGGLALALIYVDELHKCLLWDIQLKGIMKESLLLRMGTQGFFIHNIAPIVMVNIQRMIDKLIRKEV